MVIRVFHHSPTTNHQPPSEFEDSIVGVANTVLIDKLLATVIEPDDWVASDERNHASIIDGLRLSRAERFVYRHQDLDQLETGLRGACSRRSTRARSISRS